MFVENGRRKKIEIAITNIDADVDDTIFNVIINYICCNQFFLKKKLHFHFQQSYSVFQRKPCGYCHPSKLYITYRI